MLLRQCTEEDINDYLFAPEGDGDDWSVEKLMELRINMLCLDDPNLIELDGQFHKDDGSFLKISWTPCTEKPNNYTDCKSESEIAEFMHSVKIYQVHNSQKYQTDIYNH